jgi:hypothetical protein
MNLIEAAEAFILEGLNPLPLKSDGAPALEKGHNFLYEPINDVENRFARAKRIGIACGKVSDGFYAIDFDCHNGQNVTPYYNEFVKNDYVASLINRGLLSVYKTKRSGFHVYFRCPDLVMQGVVLARYEDKNTLIEVRGNGQYIAVHPSAGYTHHAGVELIKLQSDLDINADHLFNLCRSFNLFIEPCKANIPKPDLDKKWGEAWNEDTPDGRYNLLHGEEAKDILSKAGWQYLENRNDGVEYWCRPKKDPKDGMSATWGYKHNMLYIFSTAADGIEPFEPLTAYSPFQIYTLLNHDGNWKRAKDELRERFGMDKYGKNKSENGDNEKGQSAVDVIQSVMDWIAETYSIRKNAISRKIELNRQSMSDTEINSIYLKAAMHFNSRKVTKDLVRTIIESDFIKEYNPITEFIESNKDKTGVGLVDQLCWSIQSDTPNKDVFVKKWLVGIIAAYDGHPVRSVLALVGGQNTGKTEWFRRLLPAELKQYYAESKLDAGKDDEILMCEKLIVMDDEMGGKSKQDEKRFKELTSKSVFSYRAPYARHNEDRKRLAILCGTSNSMNIINDPTGNTRILPVNVLTIDQDLFNKIDKTALFMELYVMYKEGFKWLLEPSDIAALNEVSGSFEAMPYERELILQFFCRNEDEHQGYAEMMTGVQIKNYIEENSKQRIVSIAKFQQELTNVFGSSKPKKMAGKLVRVYEVVKKTEMLPVPVTAGVTYNYYDNQEDVF